jgi:hypothetical protein
MQPVDPQQAYYANISAIGETGRPGFEGQGNISPDTGGSKSYGVFGLNTWGKDPTATSAGRFAQQYGPDLGLTAPVGTPEFDAQWKQLAANKPEALQAAQMDWHQKEIGSKVAPGLTGLGIPANVASDPRVAGYFSDRMVQQGAGSIDKHAQRIQGAWAAANGDPATFLRSMSAADRQNIPNDFRTYLSQHPDHATGLSNRVGKREAMSLGDQNPMQMAFAANTPTRKPMAETEPALSPRAIAGDGVLTDPSVASRMWDTVTNPAFGNTLQQAGAYLTSISDPKGGAAMLSAAKTPNTRYQVIKDELGNQRVFDTHRGIFVNGGAGGVGTPGAGATVSGTGETPDVSTAIANSPIGLKNRADEEAKASSKKMDALQEAYISSKELKDKANEAIALVRDPNVHQGALGNVIATGKNLVSSATGGAIKPEGTEQTGALDKLLTQIQGAYISTQKGVRFAGPEIQFGKLANGDLTKQREVNEQILQDYVRQADLVEQAYALANKHHRERGVLGPAFNADLLKLYQTTPSAHADAVQPTTSNPQGLPRGVSSIKVIP